MNADLEEYDGTNPSHEMLDQPAGPGNIRPSAFVRQVASLVAGQLSPLHTDLHSETRSRLVKFWFGPDGSDHYELWLHERDSKLELGLHCESNVGHNRRVYAALDRSLVEVQARLGPSMWLEEWDHGWVRLYETQPLWPLDGARVVDVSDRFLEIISVVQPLYHTVMTGKRSE